VASSWRHSSPCRSASPWAPTSRSRLFLEPFVSFARYLPASAFIPLLILWAGIGEMQKLLVIFIGSVFQLILMIAVAVGSIRRDLVDAAYTLGATDTSVVRRVLIAQCAPEIAEIFRLVLGWAWTYVIVAELIGSSSGIGHMIIDSQALLEHRPDHLRHHRHRPDRPGLRFPFKAVNQRLFPWAHEIVPPPPACGGEGSRLLRCLNDEQAPARGS
jgi:NitT/TauT family transport system permease protein